MNNRKFIKKSKCKFNNIAPYLTMNLQINETFSNRQNVVKIVLKDISGWSYFSIKPERIVLKCEHFHAFSSDEMSIIYRLLIE